MARHLVSALDRKARLALRDELTARLDLAEAALDKWLDTHPAAEPHATRLVADKLYDATLAGYGFCIDEIRTAHLVKQAEKKA